MHDYFEFLLPEGDTLVAYAQAGQANDRWADDDANKALYRERLTYGFDQDMRKAGQEMVVPKGTEVLLETRLPCPGGHRLYQHRIEYPYRLKSVRKRKRKKRSYVFIGGGGGEKWKARIG